MYKTLNIAHRGFTKESPDNTLEAFYGAIKLKLDGVECDVQETADHRFVIFHDNELAGRNINDMPLAEIRKVKIHEHYQIPALEETLNLCHNHIKLMLELKQVESLDLFMEIINSHMNPFELFITSFNANLVRELADFAPKIPRGILTDSVNTDPLKLLETTKAKIMLPRFAYADTELVKTLHSKNYSVIVWDCNNILDLRMALDREADGIITDSAAVLALEMANRKRLEK
jgi:glycerophosphoryl diester phosphodiesterase